MYKIPWPINLCKEIQTPDPLGPLQQSYPPIPPNPYTAFPFILPAHPWALAQHLWTYRAEIEQIGKFLIWMHVHSVTERSVRAVMVVHHDCREQPVPKRKPNTDIILTVSTVTLGGGWCRVAPWWWRVPYCGGGGWWCDDVNLWCW